MDYQQLVKDCLKGKPEAQRELYEHFSPLMLAVCYRYVKSMADAEDVMQEGFFKVFRSLHQYRVDGELGAWIRRIMVNESLNHLKANKKYQTDIEPEKGAAYHTTDDDPVVRLQGKELAELIRKLPPGFRTIFNLHAVEGYKHVEIAGLLGISEGTSRSQYARARGQLIEWIEEVSGKQKNWDYERKRI